MCTDKKTPTVIQFFLVSVSVSDRKLNSTCLSSLITFNGEHPSVQHFTGNVSLSNISQGVIVMTVYHCLCLSICVHWQDVTSYVTVPYHVTKPMLAPFESLVDRKVLNFAVVTSVQLWVQITSVTWMHSYAEADVRKVELVYWNSIEFSAGQTRDWLGHGGGGVEGGT